MLTSEHTCRGSERAEQHLNRLVTVMHNNITYDVVVAEPQVLSVRKTMQASGQWRNVTLSELPTIVKEKIQKLV